eukprot:2495273-Prorocentrum_lima.AAC.1
MAGKVNMWEDLMDLAEERLAAANFRLNPDNSCAGVRMKCWSSIDGASSRVADQRPRWLSL